jgi:hypothetical protein
MALNSGTVASGDLATATQYNNLRADVVSTSSGHVHDGSLGIGSAQFILNVAGRCKQRSPTDCWWQQVHPC